MLNSLLLLIFVLWCCDVARTELVSRKQTPGDACPATATQDGGDCSAPATTFKLVQLDGVTVGHVQELNLVNGKVHHLVTRSLKPLLFEVQDFLTDEECDHIIKLAKPNLFKSTVLKGKEDDNDEDGGEEHEEICKMLITNQGQGDADNDNKVSIPEFAKYMISEASFDEEDAVALFHAFKWDANNDGFLTLKECLSANGTAIRKIVLDMEKSNPKYEDRNSEQTWLDISATHTDPVLKSMQKRLVKLTQLPFEMLQKSEPLQVVRYPVRGHFHAHYDSTEDQDANLTCCHSYLHEPAQGSCHLCRYMTVLYYLNDVSSGGETAFPIADNATYDKEEYNRLHLDNLSVACHKANLVVKPRKGTAILWYNHHINRETGEIGNMDIYSLHGGCDVMEGIKWISNNWINVPHM